MKKDKMLWAGQNKQVARSTVLNKKYHRWGNAVVLLPGETCYDLIEGIRSGMFSPSKDRFILVEHKSAVMDHVRGIVAELRCDDVYLYCGKLEDIDLVEASGGKKIDFMYLDTCSNLNPDIANWLANLPEVFTKTATIITSFASPRGSAKWFGNNFYHGRTLPGKDFQMSYSLYCERVAPLSAEHFIIDGEFIRGSDAWRKLWRFNMYERGPATERNLSMHANAVSLLLSMNYKPEYHTGFMYHDNVTRMFTNIFRLNGKNKPGVKMVEYIMSLMNDVPEAKQKQLLKAEIGRKRSLKAHAKRKLDKDLSQKGLTRDQQAAYKAAYTRRINKIIGVIPVTKVTGFERPAGLTDGAWGWHELNPNGHRNRRVFLNSK
jgi:hypothetical protein